MKKELNFLVLSALFFLVNTLRAQTPFNIDDYKDFLQQHQDLEPNELLQMHPAGVFKNSIDQNWNTALFSDSVTLKYNLTEYELELLNKNGFVVTERISEESFGHHFLNIYHSDLPVYISADAIAHSVHMSYDRILVETEAGFLHTKLIEMLELIHSQFTALENKYSSSPEILERLKDVDVYLSVPRKLLLDNTVIQYPSNASKINELLTYIYQEGFEEIQFFSSTYRKIDFSQFKPRGHYAQHDFPDIDRYFRAMIWLGRMELYLNSPVSLESVPRYDVQRQTIMSSLINEMMELSGAKTIYEEIESTLQFFVGEQDNVTPSNLSYLLENLEFNSADQLLDSANFDLFLDSLKVQSFASQRILSQALTEPMTPDSIQPASSYLIFGQRFIVDSYITGSVVFDKIIFQGNKVKRMLPSTLDILFALGNDAALQLLQPELDEYKYSQNLAAVRYLVDQYDESFWESSIYNLWLNSIRTLSPPLEREELPEFMQTAAWWQYKMNSQLSSWAQLRHDNLLYGKQSFTGIPICSFPYGYVEPIPDFFEAIKIYAQESLIKFEEMPFSFPPFKLNISNYYTHLYETADTLHSIAQKELDGSPFTPEENWFLQRLLYERGPGCGDADYNGWYPFLFYGNQELGYPYKDKNVIVADYHTAPANEAGGIVGWVNHAGTGKINLAILAAELPGGERTAFVGPVNSYHEYTTTNFLRLTDDEWDDQYLVQSNRPDWVNLYLADVNGDSLGEGTSLITSLVENNSESVIPETHIIAQNYPNPFNATTIINFKIPTNLSNSLTEITIYNINGEKIKTLLKENLPAGNYLTKWNGKNEFNSTAASGVYFYHISVADKKFVGKMSLLK